MGFSNCGSLALEHRLNSRGTWAQLHAGEPGSQVRDEPRLLDEAGGLFTPPGTAPRHSFSKFFSTFISIMLCHRILHILSRAIQENLVYKRTDL